MNKLLSLGGVFAVALMLGAGCDININAPQTPANNNTGSNAMMEETQNTDTMQEETPTTTETTNPTENEAMMDEEENTTMSNPISYTNSEFGFSLTLPATWEGYTTKTTENDMGGKTVWFGFTNWNDIFAISVYPTEVNPHPNMIYFGTDGEVYYYGSQAQAITVDSLQARWDEVSKIMSSFDVANLSDGLEDWLTYTNSANNFQIKYPTKYETTTDNYGWKNAVVLFKDKNPQAQAYDAAISVWDDINDYKAETSYSAMAYQYYKVGEKFVVISYMSLDPDTNAIWQRALDTFKKTN